MVKTSHRCMWSLPNRRTSCCSHGLLLSLTVTNRNILNWLLSVFATHGFPAEIKSDNASYFVSAEFKDTLASWGIEHTTVTEYWPQANGQVERFNQVLEKHILTAQAERKDWKLTIPIMLLNYRNTPHRMAGQTPSSLLMNRKIRTKLPSIPRQSNDDTDVRKKDKEEKEKGKKYTDSKRKAKTRNLQLGDKVLVTQKHKNKFSTKFCPDPMEIIRINGTQIVLKDKNNVQHRRNSSHVKLCRESSDPEEEIQSDHKTDGETEPQEDNAEIIQPETQQNNTNENPLRRSARKRNPPDYFRF